MRAASCFCCFLQQIISHGHLGPAEILAADRSANEKAAKPSLFCRCFPLIFSEKQQGSAKGALSQQNNSLPPLDQIRMPVRYHKARAMCQFHKYCYSMEADQNCPPPFGRHRITVQGNAIGLKSRQLLWSLSVKCSHRFGGSALVYKSGCTAVVHRRSYCDFRGAAIHEYAAHRAHVCADQRAERGVGDVMLSAAMILDARSIGVAPITAVIVVSVTSSHTQLSFAP
jgi:hypothetical protein